MDLGYIILTQIDEIILPNISASQCYLYRADRFYLGQKQISQAFEKIDSNELYKFFYVKKEKPYNPYFPKLNIKKGVENGKVNSMVSNHCRYLIGVAFIRCGWTREGISMDYSSRRFSYWY